MPKMVVTHAVVELDRWLQGKAERAEIIGKYATNVTDYVAADGSSPERARIAPVGAAATVPSGDWKSAPRCRRTTILPLISWADDVGKPYKSSAAGPRW